MRCRSFLSFAALLPLLAGAATAGTLTSATWTQTVSPVPWVSPIQITRTNAQLAATGSSTAGSINVSFSFPQLTTKLTVPATVSLFVTLTEGGAQVLTATAGMANGSPGIPGNVAVRQGATKLLLSAPLSHGQAGRISLTNFTNQIAVGDFYGWVPNTVTVKSLFTYTQTTTTQFVAKGSFDLTAKGGGTVSLVSPARLFVVGDISVDGRIHSFTTLTLHFVPEPGGLLPLGVGAIFALARARRWS